MEKNEMIEKLKDLEFNERGNLMNEISENFIDEYKHYLDSSSYICDLIGEFSDNNVDIYTSDLFDWAKYNMDYIEESVQEFGIDEKNFDFLGIIKQGQYLYNNQCLYDDLNSIIKILSFNCMIEKLQDYEKHEIDEIEINFDLDEFIENVEQIDNNNYFNDIVELVEQTIEKNNDDE